MRERKDVLSTAVSFRLSRFSRPYRQRLLAGLKDLDDFCAEEVKCSLPYLFSQSLRTDELLAQYVMRRHNTTEGKKLYLVKHALLCCQHIQPRLKGRINTAWENLRVWEEKRVSRLRPPLPVPLWMMMLGLSRGHAAVVSDPSAKLQWSLFATLLEVGLLCMFRPGEHLKLRHVDNISMPGDFTFSQPFAALRVANPKNRRQFGVEQFVLLRNPGTIQRIREIHIEGLDMPLWKDKPALFGKLFKTVCRELQITACRFTPASLRPGGALRGLKYQDLTPDQLSRAAKRYPGDQKLQRYTKAIIASQELDGEEDAEPAPCLPVAIREPSQKRPLKTGFSCCRSFALWLSNLNLHRAVVFAIFAIALVFVVKPGLATVCAQVFVKVIRLVLRRIAGFVVLLVEGLLDELIYQIEFSIRQALPSNMDPQDIVQAPFNLFSHFLSAFTGAGVSLLAVYMQARRGQIPAID
eukprot:Skav232968  [mRNA]  locus=scaffold1735:245378:247094:+ [translate_table: standard]